MNTPQIYVSYAWADAADTTREVIVDEIQKALEKEGFTLIRDKTGGVGYGKSIEAFMQAIGQGDWVVVVLSRKSLQSEFCMYEVTEIMRDRQFAARVLPVVLPDANIFDRNVRDSIVDYWEDKVTEQQAYLDKRGSRALDLDRKLLERYKLISLKLGEFIAAMTDLNSLSPQLLRENNFQAIIDHIRSKRPASPAAVPVAVPVAAPAGGAADTKDQIRQLIAKDKLKEAFKLARTILTEEESANQLTSLEGNFNRAQKDNMMGLITTSEYTTQLARVRMGLLMLLD